VFAESFPSTPKRKELILACLRLIKDGVGEHNLFAATAMLNNYVMSFARTKAD
jgi:hypothetical protein